MTFPEQVPGTTESFQPKIMLSGPGDLIYRARQLASIAGAFGLANTVKAVHGKFAGETAEPIVQLTHKHLKHRFQLRQSYSDYVGFSEVLVQEAYALPPEIGSLVDGRPIVDVGAYNGLTAAYFASRYTASTVVAIEPNKDNYPLLKANAQPYGDNIIPVEAAVVAAEGPICQTPLGARPDKMLHAYTLAAEPSANIARAITPRGIMDLIGTGEIGMLKVDIEGAEKQLFMSQAIDELLSKTNVLLIETHDAFMPGSQAAVQAAANRNNLASTPFNRHTDMYVRASKA